MPVQRAEESYPPTDGREDHTLTEQDFHIIYKWRHLELNVGSDLGAGRHSDRSLSQTFRYWVSTGTFPGPITHS